MGYIERIPKSPALLYTQILEERTELFEELLASGYAVENVFQLVIHDTRERLGTLQVWGRSGSDETVETIHAISGKMGVRMGKRGVVDEMRG